MIDIACKSEDYRRPMSQKNFLGNKDANRIFAPRSLAQPRVVDSVHPAAKNLVCLSRPV